MPMLDIDKTKKILSRYNLPFCKSLLAKSEKECIKAANSIGWPVVLKIVSPDIIHKSDVGGVVISVEGTEELIGSYNKIIKTVKKKKPKAKIKGVLVQQMCPGEEVIIGIKRDNQFGPVVMFGLGGIFVEVLKDVSFRVCPVERLQAEKMIKEIKGFPILAGARGKKPVDIRALEDMIVKISKIVMANKKIKELDFNPVIVNGKKAVIADARVLYES